jgi:hypothetical protein
VHQCGLVLLLEGFARTRKGYVARAVRQRLCRRRLRLADCHRQHKSRFTADAKDVPSSVVDPKQKFDGCARRSEMPRKQTHCHTEPIAETGPERINRERISKSRCCRNVTYAWLVHPQRLSILSDPPLFDARRLLHAAMSSFTWRLCVVPNYVKFGIVGSAKSVWLLGCGPGGKRGSFT